MLFAAVLRRLTGGFTNRGSRRRRPPSPLRPALECLEGRLVPAGISVHYSAGSSSTPATLSVSGGNGYSNLSILDTPESGTTRGQITVQYGTTKKSYVLPQAGLTVQIALAGGHNSLDYEVKGNYSGDYRNLAVDLGGGGSNTLTFSTGAHTIGNGTNYTINVVPDPGNQQTFYFDAIQSSTLNLGTGSGVSMGADTTHVYFGYFRSGIALTTDTDPSGAYGITGTSVVNVGSQTQPFALAATGATGSTFTMDVWNKVRDNAVLNFNLAGSSAADTVHLAFTHNADLWDNAKLNVNAALGGGNDSFESDFDPSTFDIKQSAQAHFTVDGGSGDNTLIMRELGNDYLKQAYGTTVDLATAGLNSNIDPGAVLDINLSGGQNSVNNTIIVDYTSYTTSDQRSPGADIGLRDDGTFDLHINGGGLNDTIQTAIWVSPKSGQFAQATFNIGITGGSGTGTISFALDDYGQQAFSGSILLDGNHSNGGNNQAVVHTGGPYTIPVTEVNFT